MLTWCRREGPELAMRSAARPLMWPFRLREAAHGVRHAAERSRATPSPVRTAGRGSPWMACRTPRNTVIVLAAVLPSPSCCFIPDSVSISTAYRSHTMHSRAMACSRVSGGLHTAHGARCRLAARAPTLPAGDAAGSMRIPVERSCTAPWCQYRNQRGRPRLTHLAHSNSKRVRVDSPPLPVWVLQHKPRRMTCDQTVALQARSYPRSARTCLGRVAQQHAHQLQVHWSAVVVAEHFERCV